MATLRSTPQSLLAFTPARWEATIHAARRANLLSRLAADLDDAGLLAQVPGAPRAHLDAALIVARAQREAVLREVALICAALAGVGIDVVLLKGAAYVLADLPVARGRVFSDVDILVPGETLAAVEAALMLHGWSTTHHDAYDQRYYRQWMHELPPLRHNVRSTVVDVHHAILPLTARVKPPSAKLLAAARPVEGDARVRVLCPVDMVLHSATHLFQNEELTQGLRDIADLDGLLRHFGPQAGFWDELPRRAAELGLARPLYYGLRFASRFMDTPVPADVLRVAASGRPPRLVRALMDVLYDRALRLDEEAAAGWLSPLARRMLYVRAHWLRMPPTLLARHLSVKAFRRQPDPA